MSISTNSLVSEIPNILEDIQNNLFNQADDFMNKNTFELSNYDEFKKRIDKGGFVRCGWDGSEKTEKIIKEETKATIRCIPFDESPQNKICILTGSPARHEVIFAKAY